MIKKIILASSMALILTTGIQANNFKTDQNYLNEISKMMDKKINMINQYYKKNFSKNYNILETKDAFVYEFDFPGLNKKNIKMYIENNILFLKGEKVSSLGNEKRNYQYTLTLPKNIDINSIKAFMKNGVLKVVFLKTKKQTHQLIKIN